MAKGIRLLLLILAWLPCQAQIYYTATKTTSLNAGPEVITVQAPTTAAGMTKNIQLVGASITCSVACTATLERDGTAATGTTLASTALLKSSPAATTTAWSSSNVGTGTVLSNYSIAAGATLPVDLSSKWLASAGENVTIRTNSITGTVYITFMWIEWNPSGAPDPQH
jgi:hypothetical protein